MVSAQRRRYALSSRWHLLQRTQTKAIPQVVEETIKTETSLKTTSLKMNRGRSTPYEKDIPFYKTQVRVALRNCGRIDPTSLDDYIRNDGYQAIAKVLSNLSPDTVIDTVKQSGLRGREARAFQRGPNGALPDLLQGTKNISSVTPTKVIPEHLWTGRFWRAILIQL